MAQVLFDADETATLRADVAAPPLGNQAALGQRSATRRRLFQGAQSDRTLDAMDIAIPSLTIGRVREGLLSRRFSAVELAAEALRFAEAENPKTNAYLHFSPERALAAAAARGRADRARRRSRAAGRRARGGEGRHRHQGRPHHLRLEAAGQLHSALRRHGRGAPGSRPAA